MEHTNEIAIKILSDEYHDYKYHYNKRWHYDREYKMIVNALSEYDKIKNRIFGDLPDDCIIGFDDVKFCGHRQGDGNRCKHCKNT